MTGQEKGGMSKSAAEVDQKRRGIEGMIEGVNLVKDGVLVGFSLGGLTEKDAPYVTAESADTALQGLKAAFGQQYPDLFVDLTALEFAEGNTRRTSEVFAYPAANAQLPTTIMGEQPIRG